MDEYRIQAMHVLDDRFITYTTKADNVFDALEIFYSDVSDERNTKAWRVVEVANTAASREERAPDT